MSQIIGSGSYVPSLSISNSDFYKNTFFNKEGKLDTRNREVLIGSFEKLTGIKKRGICEPAFNTSDMAACAAEAALATANLDREHLDYLIVAHDWGDVTTGTHYPDILPNVAARVKHKLHIQNSRCVAFDILFGCPGWLEGVIQANYILTAGAARYIMVIGADAVSRVTDKHDIDSLLFGDGAGAVILKKSENPSCGLLAHLSASYCDEELTFLSMGNSNCPDVSHGPFFLKMQGRKVAEFAVSQVPLLILECLERANVRLEVVAKFLLHQANGKMLESLVRQVFALAGRQEPPHGILPLTVDFLGNSAVATLPILYDLMVKGNLPRHSISQDDVIVFASVGAGMHINCMVYKNL